jgi:PAS domain S-box-containing protein
MPGTRDGMPLAGGYRQSDLEFWQLLEKLPAAAYTCDAQGLITFYNPQAVELWGRAPAVLDPVDRYCGSFRLFALDNSPICHSDCWMALALRDRQPYNGHEIVVERPDGSRRTVLAHANPVQDAEGALIGAVNVLVDISDRKRSEELLRLADRRKDEFLATLAHELRNPLAPIRTGLELIKIAGDDSALMEEVRVMMEQQVQQMVRLVDDLLDVSRITTGRVQLRTTTLELNEQVQQVVDSMRPLVDKAGMHLSVALPSDPVVLEADPHRLSQVLANLLDNAIKYSEPGARIGLSVETSETEAVIVIRDTGIGIPAHRLQDIFEMFTQIEHSPERTRSGLGIGLTLVKNLVELHGGTVEARSDGPGRGTQMVVRFPLAAGPLPHAVRAAGTSGSIHNLRVLVVDDNKAAATSLSMLLKAQGHEVQTCHTSRDALQQAEQFRPALILLDIGLPWINGYEVARRIRSEAWGRDIGIVAVTGWGQEGDRQRSKEAGFDQHVVKPIEPDTLQRLLADMSANPG